MNAALPRHATSCCAIAGAALGLTRIFDPQIQLAQWRRPVDTVIADWLENAIQHCSLPGNTP